MPQSAKQLAKQLGEFIVQQDATVRAAAAHSGVPKSTVHTLVTRTLRRTDRALAQEVRQVLDRNKAERHIRGGIATRHKYHPLEGGADAAPKRDPAATRGGAARSGAAPRSADQRGAAGK